MSEASDNQKNLEPNPAWLSKFERVDLDAAPKNEEKLPPNPSWLKKFEPVSRPSEVQALRQGMIGGAAEFSPVIPATAAGAKVGAAIGALGGPLAPVTVPFGGIVGGALGFWGGMEVGEQARAYLSEIEDPFDKGKLTTRTLEDVPREVRSYAVAGETLGSTVTGGLGLVGVAKTGVRAGERILTGSWLNPILNAARNRTKTFLATEGSAGMSAATLGGASQEVFPDNNFARFSAEVAGGYLNPTRLVLASWDMGVGIINKVVRANTESGRQSRASKVLGEILEEFGDDPVVVAQLLREDPEIQGLLGSQTSAQKSGSQALIALQSALAKRDARFGKKVAENANAITEVLSAAIVNLRNQGDPESLRAASALTAHAINSAMQLQVKSAASRAKEAVSTMVGQGNMNKSAISKQARDVLNQALADVKVQERKLWGNVPKQVPVTGDAIAEEIADIVANTLVPGDKLPPQITAFAKNYKKLHKLMAKGKDVPDSLLKEFTSGKIQGFRSRMLDLARDSASGASPNTLYSQVFNRIANAALEDMDEALSADEAYTLARTFTKAKAEAFNKTFAGKSLQRTGTGADQLDPELLLSKVFSGGQEAVALKASELVDASGFLALQNLIDVDNVKDYAVDMMDLQEQYLRAFIFDAVDADGVKPSVLKNIQKKNSELLERFPDLSAQIGNALKSDRALSELRERVAGKTKIIESKTALANLLTEGVASARLVAGDAVGVIENPASAIRKIVGGNQPKRDLGRIIGLAKRSEETMRGLQASVLDYAMAKANGDLAKLRSALFDPIDNQTPSIIKMMQQYNAVDADYIGRLNQIFNEADKVARSQLGGGLVEGIDEAAGMIEDLAARFAGSTVVTGAAQAVGSSANSLILAGGGARAARNIFNKVPNKKLAEVLQDVAENPEFMAMLLERAPDPKRRLDITKQMHAYLLQAGYFALTDDEQDQ